jgi:hypothetical protein
MHGVKHSPINGMAREPVEVREVEVIREVEVVKEVEVYREVERARPLMSDVSVDTSDLQPIAPPVLDRSEPVRAVEKPKEKPTKQAPPTEDDGASDVFSVMLGMLFSTVFSLFYLVLVRIPIRIVSFTFLATVTGVVVSMAWLYLADDNGAGEMGARVSYGFNRAGIV